MLKLKRLKLLNSISAKFLPNFSIEKGLTACTLVLIYNFVFCEIFYVFYALCWKINKDAFSKDLVILTNIRFFCWDQQNYHENLKNNEFLPITPFWKIFVLQGFWSIENRHNKFKNTPKDSFLGLYLSRTVLVTTYVVQYLLKKMIFPDCLKFFRKTIKIHTKCFFLDSCFPWKGCSHLKLAKNLKTWC